MLGEFLVFDRMTSQYHTGVYPRWTDQTQYLSEAYAGYQNLQAQGFWSGLATTITHPVAQGKLHDVLAVLVFWLAGGASRSAALSLNLLALLAWQAALFAIIPRVSGSRALGWIGFALPLCLAWPWSVGPGSAVDFRLDHAAMCLMGVAGAFALLTDGFRSWRGSVVFGAAVGVTLLERFLTGAYFILIFAAAAVWILQGDSRLQRLRNLLLAGLTAALLAVPLLWLNWGEVWKYYWGGHILSADGDARAPGLDLGKSVQFILTNLGQGQLGPYFGWTVAALTGLLLVACLAARRRVTAPDDRNGLFFALVFLLAPAAVLCLHRQKSEVVIGVIVPGVLLLLLWIWTALWHRIDFTLPRPWLRVIPALAAVATVEAGENYFLQRQLTPPHTAQFLVEARQINQLADYLFTASRQAGLTRPRLGVDQVSDELNARTMALLCFERQKTMLPFHTVLPTSILSEKDEQIMVQLEQCDFFLLTKMKPLEGYYPYDHQMRRLYPTLKSWCETHLRNVDTFLLLGHEVSLYQRREIPLVPATTRP